MSINFNINFEYDDKTHTLAGNELKSGLKKDDIQDSRWQQLISIFDADNNGILEQSEIDNLNISIQKASSEDGDANSLTNNELSGLLKTLGAQNLSVDDFKAFLFSAKSISSTIDNTYRSETNPDEIIINYKPVLDGSNRELTYNSNTGNLIKNQWTTTNGEEWSEVYSEDGSFVRSHYDGSILYFDSDGKCTGGKVANSLKTYTRTNNPNGSYMLTYSDDSVENYDADGRWTGGITSNGEEYTNEYDEEGNRTWKCGNRSAYISKDGDLLREVDENGNSYSVATLKNNDGTKVELYNDGREYTYDELGRCIGGKRTDGTTFTYEYDSDGNYTYKDSNGEETTFNYNEKLTGGKIARTNITYTRKYAEGDKYGSYRYDEYQQEDGSKIYKGANGTIARRSTAGSLTIKNFAKHGQSIESVMNKLGIHSSADKAAFRQANPAAAEKGKFEVGQLDVIIPKKLADNINLESILGDKDKDSEKNKPKMGV